MTLLYMHTSTSRLGKGKLAAFAQARDASPGLLAQTRVAPSSASRCIQARAEKTTGAGSASYEPLTVYTICFPHVALHFINSSLDGYVLRKSHCGGTLSKEKRSAHFSCCVLSNAGDKGEINKENCALGKTPWANGKSECFKQKPAQTGSTLGLCSVILQNPCDRFGG